MHGRPRTPLRLAVLVVALAGSSGAWAHGDPASHYLESEQLYPAFADPPSQRVELELLGHLQAAEKRGYPIKVALVATPDDLTDDPSMLRRPQGYANFVASQLGLGAPVVVVTPYGLGVSGRMTLQRRIEVPAGAHGNELARAAIAAVRQLTAAAGRPLPARVPPAAIVGARSSSGTDAGDGGGVNVWLMVGLFAMVFVPAIVLFELRGRFAARR